MPELNTSLTFDMNLHYIHKMEYYVKEPFWEIGYKNNKDNFVGSVKGKTIKEVLMNLEKKLCSQ